MEKTTTPYETKEPCLAMASDDSKIRNDKVVSERAADETLRLVEEHGGNVGELTPQIETRLKRKICLYVLFLVTVIDLILYVCAVPATHGVKIAITNSYGWRYTSDA